MAHFWCCPLTVSHMCLANLNESGTTMAYRVPLVSLASWNQDQCCWTSRVSDLGSNTLQRERWVTEKTTILFGSRLSSSLEEGNRQHISLKSCQVIMLWWKSSCRFKKDLDKLTFYIECSGRTLWQKNIWAMISEMWGSNLCRYLWENSLSGGTSKCNGP